MCAVEGDPEAEREAGAVWYNTSAMKKSRILLLIPTTSYRAKAFIEAADKLTVEIVVGSDKKQILSEFASGKSLLLDFTQPEKSTESIVAFAKLYPLNAVIPTDDETTIVAAMASKTLLLPHNPMDAVVATRNKHDFRQLLSQGEFPTPHFELFSIDDDPKRIATRIEFPCVLKPLSLSASRGVIRTDDPKQFVAAFRRITAILHQPDAIARGKEEARHLLVEEYIPGKEVVLEGILYHGKLKVLALFDKPDPLEGPYFEETIYVTPSRLPHAVQDEIKTQMVRVVERIGLKEGPIHAEFRVNENGIWPLEVAARSIGGHCSQALRFETGLSLEELILRHALRVKVESIEREKNASGVMMIPIPHRGILKEVRGLEKARGVPSIEEIKISIKGGQPVVPLPEGSKYLGFIFARHETPEGVEKALRATHRRLEFVITPQQE